MMLHLNKNLNGLDSLAHLCICQTYWKKTYFSKLFKVQCRYDLMLIYKLISLPHFLHYIYMYVCTTYLLSVPVFQINHITCNSVSLNLGFLIWHFSFREFLKCLYFFRVSTELYQPDLISYSIIVGKSQK